MSIAMTACVPIVLGVLCGGAFGTAILEPAEITTPFAAAVRGLMVSVLAFLLLFSIPMILTSVTSPDILGTIIGFGIIFLYAVVIVGWLVAAVGTVAGCMLYLVGLRGKSRNENQN